MQSGNFEKENQEFLTLLKSMLFDRVLNRRIAVKVKRNKFDKTICQINFETPQVEFEVELRGYITILEGESNTGKSFLLKSLYQTYLDNPKSFERYKIEGVFYYNCQSKVTDLFSDVKRQRNSLFLIDNADSFLISQKEYKAIEYIRYDCYNQYLIVSRLGAIFYVTPNHFAKLKREGNKIVTTFDWSVPGWH